MREKSTPMRAIRAYCLTCQGKDKALVKTCFKVDCSLHQLRLGRKDQPGSPITKIKQRCHGCGEGTAQAIRKCEITDCEIYQYRNGKSPAHQASWRKRHNQP